jgi:alanine dehydrogenase
LIGRDGLLTGAAMQFGVPRETLANEHRVGLSPFGVMRLTRRGHQVFVEHDAGADCHFTDKQYGDSGATVVYSTDEVFQRSDVLCRVGPLGAREVELVREGATVCGFLELAVAPRANIAALLDKKVTLIGYEIAERDGRRAALVALAEIAGHLAVHTAAHLLGYAEGGRGLLLGGVPGIPPSTVVVLGAGTGGRAAARLAAACGAHVVILDTDMSRLRQAQMDIPGQPASAYASEHNVGRYVEIADVVIGAALTPGGASAMLVTEDMVEHMKPGSVIFDMSIGLGGCIETSRPTTLDSPTFTLHDVIHYCVPNMTAAVPRTASRALTIEAIDFLIALGDGVGNALRADPGLAAGVYAYGGEAVHAGMARLAERDPKQLADLLAR